MNNQLFYILRDEGGFQTWFEARAVIEYSGRLTSTGESRGHYFCDVKDKQTNSWFRTNDNSNPVKIGIAEVSKNGYAFLFQRI